LAHSPPRGATSGARTRLRALTAVAEQPLHRALGLTDGELDRICDLLGRDPNHFELAVFSLLWSEHCGYKHSALLLRRLPSTGARVLQGPGENAGVVDIGDGYAVAFKVESHNHPSAVEPFQGAATGVGGILRDVVAMGARPIALLDSLRFGDDGWKFDRAVGGISHYGNCTGVPTVGGEAVFDEAYADNCLVNAMCVGLLPTERLTRAGAGGRAGSLVVLYGATTGRDGIGGASVLASQELAEPSLATATQGHGGLAGMAGRSAAGEKRPSVQIGDPFTGKKLIEASLELVERRLVESLQDCGAAGLASALAEMARDGAGIDVHLDRVPLREAEMEPWEIMISESQERMVAVLRPEFAAAVAAVCDRWELAHAVIGEVTETGALRALHGGDVVGDIPAELLTEQAPRYRVETVPRPVPAASRPIDAPPAGDALLELLASPNVRSRAWIYRQYDHLVGSRTVRRPGLDAAVLRIRGTRGIAVSLDGQGRIARLAPRTGGALAIFESARNVACAGGRPLAFTDCLNFGNPEKPEQAWELAEAIEGMGLACEQLGLPVVSGNVSLYNETDGRPIHPTPVVGCVGVVDDVRLVPGAWREGDVVLLAGAGPISLNGSEYQARFGSSGGMPAPVDYAAEAALVEFLWRSAPYLSLAHDASEGGLAVALAEAALASGVGAELDLPDDAVRLFGEGGGQAVMACPREHVGILEGAPLRKLGVVGGVEVAGIPLDELADAWRSG
jgi:phosphoribosylformylglycinamidine synthase II